MTQGIFITGTGTDVGKTVAAAGLLRYLKVSAVDVLPMKPVQTGATAGEGGGLVAPDLEYHCRAAGISPTPEDLPLMAPYLYEPACSPHLAGRLAGVAPKVEHVTTCAQKLLTRHQFLLVEGAGGIMVPLNESETMVDLMKALAFPVILVAHIGLGTINHTLLSLQALRAAGLEVLGIIFCDPTGIEEDFISADNPGTIAQFGNIEILGNLPHLPDLTPDNPEFWTRFNQSIPGLPKIKERLLAPLPKK
jgi:dethiobiotin synthase